MSSNFGPINRDHFSQNIHIKGATVIDAFRNITGNTMTSESLVVQGNSIMGNIVSNKLIVGNIITAHYFIGPVYGNVYDSSGTQLLTERQPIIDNPDPISTFIPDTNINIAVVPTMTMPTLGPSTIPMSTDIKENSVEHMLYYNHVVLRNEVESLRTQVVNMLEMLRKHGIINQ